MPKAEGTASRILVKTEALGGLEFGGGQGTKLAVQAWGWVQGSEICKQPQL